MSWKVFFVGAAILMLMAGVFSQVLNTSAAISGGAFSSNWVAGNCIQAGSTFGFLVTTSGPCGAGSLTGSGTTNSIPVWTSSSALGNSSITDNGSAIASTEPATFGGLTDSGVTGSSQCAQFSSAGLLSGTGSPCTTIPTVTHVVSFQSGTPGGAALSTGVLGYFSVPTACTIAAAPGGGSAWTIEVDAGTATLQLWGVAAGTAVPTSSNNLISSATYYPAISTGTVKQSTVLTDWTTAITAGEILGADLSTVSGVGYIDFQVVLSCGS